MNKESKQDLLHQLVYRMSHLDQDFTKLQRYQLCSVYSALAASTPHHVTTG